MKAKEPAMSASLAALLSRPQAGKAAPSARLPLRRASHLLALEQRFMFDGAAVADAAHAAGDAAVLAQVAAVPAAVEVRAADPTLDNGKKEAVLVDTSVADYKTLEAGIAAGMAIIEFDGSKDGLAQIANWAAGQSGYDAIHILSHGSEATLNLGTTVLTDSRLADSLVQAELAELGHALKAGGDLLLYGCDLAANSDGAQFLSDLAAATGADVAASTDATGAAAKGGDWTLEAATGAIEATAISAERMADFGDVLALVNLDGPVTSGNKTWNGSSGADTFKLNNSENYAGGTSDGSKLDQVGNFITNFQVATDVIDFSAVVSDFTTSSIVLSKVASFRDPAVNEIVVTAAKSDGTLASTAAASGTTGTMVTVSGNGAWYIFFLSGVNYTDLTLSNFFFVGPTTAVTGASLSADTGSSNSDFITNTASQTISGTLSTSLVAGEKVEVSYNGGSTWSDATTYSVGSSSWSTTTTLSGSNTFMARVTDTNGSSIAYSHSYTLDNTAPAAPSAPDLTSGTDSGTSNTDNITSNTTPTFTGADTANSTITLYDTDGTTVLGTTTADGSGNWTITPSSALTEGSHTLTVKATDLAGNTSSASSGLSVTIDTTAPTVSNVTASTADGSYKVGDTVSIQVNFSEAVTVTGTPQLTLETGSTDRVVNYASGSGSSTLVFTYTVQAGDTSADLDYLSTTALALNSGTIKDTAGNNATLTLASPGAAGSLGANKAIVVDTTAPGAPSTPDMTAATDSGSSSTDNITSNTTPTFTGTGENGATVTLFKDANNNGVVDSGENLGTATVSGGAWSITASTLADGTYAIKSIQTDVAGNTSAASSALSVTIDTTSPTTPTVNNLSTASTTPTLTGTATLGAGETLTVTVGGATYNVTPSGGNWSLDLSSATPASGTLSLSAGNTYSVTATANDTAGNSVSDGSSNELSILTGPPPTTTGSTITLSVDTGTSSTDLITNTASQTISGTLTAATVTGETVEVSVDGGNNWSTATNTVGSSSFSISATLSAGTHALKVRVANANGGGTAYSQNYTLDTTAPTTTIASAAFSADTGTSSSDFITSTAAQTISGTLSANLTNGEVVQVSLDNGATWTTAATTVGQNTWSLSGQTLSGSNTLKVRVWDTAGNSGTTFSQAYTLDTTVPTNTIATAALSADTGLDATDMKTQTASQTISGTLASNLVSGEVVKVSLNNGATWATATTTVGQNTWSLSGQTLDGSNTLMVKVTDAAGNDGTVLSRTYTIDGTAPTVASATVNGNTLVLTYNEALASGVTPEYEVKVGGAKVTVNAVAYDAAAKTVTLTLAAAVAATDTVTVTYTADGTPAHEVQDPAGNLAADLTDRAVTNNTASAQTQVPPPVPVVDPAPPAPPTPVTPPAPPQTPVVSVTPTSFNSAIVLSNNPVGDTSLTGIVSGGSSGDLGKGGSDLGTTPTLTRATNNGFPVAVKSGGFSSDGLQMNRPITDQTLTAGGRTEVTVPADTFSHSNPNAVVTLTAKLANGAALPAWVSFDAQKGKFVMQPPPGVKGDIAIRLVARDTAGREVVTVFTVHVNQRAAERGAQLLPGRPGLSEQLQIAAAQGDSLAALRLALGDQAATVRG